MRRDIRDTALFQEAERIFRDVHRPGEGLVSDMADLQLSPAPSRLLFTGTLVEDLGEPAITRICAFDLASEAIEVLTSGPHSDRHARTAPDRRTIAFLSDRDQPAGFQLFFIDPQSRAVTAAPHVEGWIEYLDWSPDGRRILLGVAGHGADLSSGQGAYRTGDANRSEPGWMPQVTGGSVESPGRRAWILDVESGRLSRAGERGNVWEATWCGPDRLAAITSSKPEEGAWYGAELSLIDLATGGATLIHKPRHQLAVPRSSPAGNHLAFIEAIASDRGYVAGEVRLYDLRDNSCRTLECDDVDATYLEWRSEDRLLIAGYRSLETVVLSCDLAGADNRTLWQSSACTTSEEHAKVVGLDRADDFAFICEGFFQRPAIATVQAGSFHLAKPYAPDPPWSAHCGEVEEVRWQAPDGLPIEGWLLHPDCAPPYPTILDIHGGPVAQWRPCWIGRSPANVMLLQRGHALFLPNPRGSSGRGQAFAEQVLGDVAGADTADFLSGIEHLVAAGLSDPARLGVTGLSYGGYMTCWLTTQDTRFGAAISVGPASNHVTHHLLGNIPEFVSLFLQDHYTNPAGRYYSRSPILHAHRSETPTLLVCGSLDRCTPPEEAFQFHNALVENGVETAVLNYPQEGHGIRGMLAAIDFAARATAWFERHLSA